jgi:hypothetical protein
LNNQANDIEVKPGEFPFPLTTGAKESPFLTWLRNHSKYMAARGLFDYFRMVAVLVRGILINNLVILPALLMIALALAFVYGKPASVTRGHTTVVGNGRQIVGDIPQDQSE